MIRSRTCAVPIALLVVLSGPAAAQRCEQRLLASDGAGTGGWYGFALAMDGPWMLVSDPWDEGTGSVFVNEYGPAGWSEVAKLFASDAASGDHFGESLAVQGDCAVGARPDCMIS